MKGLLAVIALVTLVTVPAIARAQECVTVPNPTENKALSEGKVNKWPAALVDFQAAKNQRIACTKTTTGETQKWMVFWGAFDQWGMSKATGDPNLKKLWLDDAHKVCGILLQQHLTGDLLAITKRLSNDTKPAKIP
jgi:hypothetical protein